MQFEYILIEFKLLPAKLLLLVLDDLLEVLRVLHGPELILNEIHLYLADMRLVLIQPGLHLLDNHVHPILHLQHLRSSGLVVPYLLLVEGLVF